MKAVPSATTDSSKTNNSNTAKKNNNTNPPIYITEKQGKRFLVINPSSPALVEGFAGVDNQYAGFRMPLFNNIVQPRPQFPSFPPFQQISDYDGSSVGDSGTQQDFGTPGIFPAAFRGPWSSMRVSGMPVLRGQTVGGVFRGFMAVPVLSSRLPVANRFSQPLLYPQRTIPAQQMMFPATPQYSMYHHTAPSYFQQQPPHRVYQTDRFPIFQKFQRHFYPPPQQRHVPYYASNNAHDELLDRTPSSMEAPGFYQHHIAPPQPPKFGLEDYQYMHDAGEPVTHDENNNARYEEGTYPRPIPVMQPQQQEIPYNEEQPRPIQLRPTFDNGQQQQQQQRIEQNIGDPAESMMPSPIATSQGDDIHETEVEANRGSMFSSDFNGPFGEQNHFDKSTVENQQAFTEDNQMVKRSRQQQHHQQGPYVFTKDHVGFGPITVEAHTASYKSSDPKDDDK